MLNVYPNNGAFGQNGKVLSHPAVNRVVEVFYTNIEFADCRHATATVLDYPTFPAIKKNVRKNRRAVFMGMDLCIGGEKTSQ